MLPAWCHNKCFALLATVVKSITKMLSVRNYCILTILIAFCSAVGFPGEPKCLNNKTSFDGVALILARGGSKGIPRKNLVNISGISLLGRTINVIYESGVFSQVWVSTEDAEIGAEAEKYGASVHKRPMHLAHDITPSIEAVQDFIQSHPDVNSVALFQCTSVFLRKCYILEACQLFQEADCVFAATRDFKLRWTFDENNQYLRPVNFDPSARPRRQDWNGEIVETGMFYLSKRELLLDGVFQNDKCKVVIIEKDDSLELDSPSDLKLAKYLIE